MCGDLEEDEGDSKLEEMLYARFVAHARALLAHAPRRRRRPPTTAATWRSCSPMRSAAR